MLRKSVALFMVLVTFLCLFTACSDGADEDFYYPIYADPVSFDPQIASDNASKIVVFNCFEGLVRNDENGKIIPGVAKSWKISPDGLVYTFYLRGDSKWYMSQYAKELLDEESAENFNYNVIAEDFVYGLKRAFDPVMGAVTDSRLYSIKNAYDVYTGKKTPDELGVTAINSSTLQITLSEPDEDFLNALTQSAAMPCREEFFLATKGRYGLDPEKVIYNGPFYLYSWSTGSHLVLYRNENYSGEADVKPSALFLYINSDLSTRVSKLVDGVYSACPLSVRQKETINDKDVTYIGYSNSTWGFCFNCADENLSDYNMRSALTASLDVTKLPMPSFCNGYADGLVPDICMTGNTSYRSRAGKVSLPDINATQAKKYLSLAFEDLDIKSATLNIICPESFESTVKIAVQNWQSVLGVHLNFVVEPLDEVTLDKRVKNRDFDIAFTKITAESQSVVSFLGMFTSSSSGNIFDFKSKKYDSLMGIADETLSQDTLLSNCAEAEQHLTDMSVFLPVFSEDSFLGLADDVSGVYCVEAGTVPIFCNGIAK